MKYSYTKAVQKVSSHATVLVILTMAGIFFLDSPENMCLVKAASHERAHII